MGSILDYEKINTPFSDFPFGAVDALILSELAMCDIWRESTCLADYADAQMPVASGSFHARQDWRLLKAAAGSVRYGGIFVTDYEQETGEDYQFAAVTFHLSDEWLFVAFRGTDRSLTGWKEDCALAYRDPIPSQTMAKDYVSRIGSRYPGDIMLGGHSKGGNLAVYAAGAGAVSPERIRAVYSFDGPGMSDHPSGDDVYARLKETLHAYVPQGSMVGLLLGHPSRLQVIRSSAIGLLQHDPFTWQVKGEDFVYEEALSQASRDFDRVFHQWVALWDDTQRKTFVDAVFEVLSSPEADAFGGEWWRRLLSDPGKVIRSVNGIDPAAKETVMDMWHAFWKIAGGGMV